MRLLALRAHAITNIEGLTGKLLFTGYQLDKKVRYAIYLSAIFILLFCCNTNSVKPILIPVQPITDSIHFFIYGNTDSGFGYRISRRGRNIIDQPYIPTVEGNHPFVTADDAAHTAVLVKQKLRYGLFPPAINRQELDSMHIRY